MELLQRTLRGSPVADPAPDRSQRTIDLAPDSVEVADPRRPNGRPMPICPKRSASFLDGLGQPGAGPDLGGLLKPRPAAEPLPEGARFLTGVLRQRRRHPRATGSMSPATIAAEPVPLLVMLHGCTQSPDDFAAGTRHERAGRGARLLVAYPAQDACGQRRSAAGTGSTRTDQAARPGRAVADRRHDPRDHARARRRPGPGLRRRACPPAAPPPRSWRPPTPTCSPPSASIPASPAAPPRDLPSAFAAMRQGAAPSSRPAGPEAGAHHRLPRRPGQHGRARATATGSSPRRAPRREGLQATAAVQRGEAPGGHAYSRTALCRRRRPGAAGAAGRSTAPATPGPAAAPPAPTPIRAGPTPRARCSASSSSTSSPRPPESRLPEPARREVVVRPVPDAATVERSSFPDHQSRSPTLPVPDSVRGRAVP